MTLIITITTIGTNNWYLVLSFGVVKAHVPENVVHKVKHFFVKKIEIFRLVPILKQPHDPASDRRRLVP